MRVHPNSESAGLNGIPKTERTAARATRPQQDELVLTTADKLNQTLKQTPSVRAEKVARAKALIADSSYPPKAVIDQVAAVLAPHIRERA